MIVSDNLQRSNAGCRIREEREILAAHTAATTPYSSLYHKVCENQIARIEVTVR